MDDTWYKQFQEVNSSIKLLSDLSARIDERLEFLIDNNNEAKDRIEKLVESQTIILTRIGILENRNDGRSIEDMKKDLKMLEVQVNELSDRIIHVEKEVGQQNGKWTQLIDFTFKLGEIIIAGIILWKLGVK